MVGNATDAPAIDTGNRMLASAIAARASAGRDVPAGVEVVLVKVRSLARQGPERRCCADSGLRCLCLSYFPGPLLRDGVGGQRARGAPAIGGHLGDPDLNGLRRQAVGVDERVRDLANEIALQRDITWSLKHSNDWHRTLPSA